MSEPAEVKTRTEVRDGMRITWHEPIAMADGVILRADVYRPVEEARYPVILSHGIYAKGLAYAEAYPMQWQKMVADHPEILAGSSNRYQAWEVTDPERWVPHGYAVVRVDSRGAGWSPGFMDPLCPQEDDDLARCIEWAGTQPWSSGKVGMLGISYYAINQWRVAAKHRPPHLAALIPWEGFTDFYRDAARHGGILCEFMRRWAPAQALTVQHGLGERAKKNPNTGESVAGPETRPEAELAGRRADPFADIQARPLDDAWYRARSADLSRVTVPFLSCANWGGQGIHPRGNFNAFVQAPAPQKWLEVHGESHWSLFSSGYGLALQKRFFDYFLKGVQNGWDKQPRVQLNIRHPGERFVLRHENEWPLARTRWTKLYLDPATRALSRTPVAQARTVTYDGLGDGVTFSMTVERPTEITGPIAARLFVSSSTRDADLFLIVRVFDPAGGELTFFGSTDPNTPIANGWLRASHRRLDAARSTPWQPWHPHDRDEPLTPGEVYECEVEILPTCIVVPAGWRVALTVRGRDYEYEGEIGEFGKTFVYGTRGTGGMTHPDPTDRPRDVFGGTVTLHAGGGRDAYLLLPIIPGAA